MEKKVSKVEIKSYEYLYRFSATYCNGAAIVLLFTTECPVNDLGSYFFDNLLESANSLACTTRISNNKKVHLNTYDLTLVKKEEKYILIPMI